MSDNFTAIAQSTISEQELNHGNLMPAPAPIEQDRLELLAAINELFELVNLQQLAQEHNAAQRAEKDTSKSHTDHPKPNHRRKNKINLTQKYAGLSVFHATQHSHTHTDPGQAKRALIESYTRTAHR